MDFIQRQQSVLVAVDVQDAFYKEHRRDVDRAEFDSFVDRVAWVVGTAAVLGVPVVVTEEDPDGNGSTFELVRMRLPSGAAVLPKPVFGAGDNPPILAAIEATGRSTVVLVGLETDVCVSHSALSLIARGFRVAAVSDALFSPGQAHANGIARLRSAGVGLVSAKELFYDWTRTLDAVRTFVDQNPELADPPGFSL